MIRIRLYFHGTGLNASRCVGGAEALGVRNITESHEFDLPDDLPLHKVMSKSPNQIIEMGGQMVVPLKEKYEPGYEM